MSQNLFTYSTDGPVTSSPELAQDFLEKSKVRFSLFRKKPLLSYLQPGTPYFSQPGLAVTNVLGKACTSMVPQGICCTDSYLLVSAYDGSHTKGISSVIYVMTLDGNYVTTLVYNKACHMGGLAFDGERLWCAEGGHKVSFLHKSELEKTILYGKQTGASSIALPPFKSCQLKEVTSTSFCTYAYGLLFFGSFFKDKACPVLGYRIVPDAESAVADPYLHDAENLTLQPVIQFYAPKKTQGISFYSAKGKKFLVASTSYGRNNTSKFFTYEISWIFDTASHQSPQSCHNLQSLQSLNLPRPKRKLILPPSSMTEDLCYKDGILYCASESGARIYSNSKGTKIPGILLFDAEQLS